MNQEEAQQPVAWAAVWPDDGDGVDCNWIYSSREDAEWAALKGDNIDGRRGVGTVIPLYRQPQLTLTDEERRMNDENERSVAGEPMAWAVVLSDGQPYERCDFRWEAQAIADALPANEGVSATVVPLYPQPTLTDEEREAVKMGISTSEQIGQYQQWADRLNAQAAATLRGLLEKHNGGGK